GAARSQAIAAKSTQYLDVDVAYAVGLVPRRVQTVDDATHHLLGARVCDRAHLGHERAALGHHVHRTAALDRADVHGRFLVEAPQLHRRDRASRGQDRRTPLLGADAGVRGGAAERGLDAKVTRRGDHYLADGRCVVEYVADV